MLTFKRKLILNKAQAARIEGWFGVCRLVYNMCLEIRKEGWKNHQKLVSRFELDAQIKTIRDIDWVADCPFDSMSNAIKRMDLAYKKFFKGGGFPRFASKKKVNSFIVRDGCHVKNNKIRICKIGWLKIFKDSPVIGTIKTITIKKERGSYYACITTDAVKSIRNQDDSQILGIDMGVSRLYTDSNGSHIENPRHYKVYERKIRIESRSLSRKKKGGRNWIKQAKRLSKLHNKIGNVRKDFLHKESTKIAKGFNTVILEDLNVSGMVKGNLSKQISDVGWSTFRAMLEYKTNVVAINPAYTSQTCYDCGVKDKKSRISQSEFVCTACGTKNNADENAALNILGLGRAIIAQRKATA